MNENNTPPAFLWGVVAKAALLFVILNLLFAVLNPLPWLGEISAYNTLAPGRARFPFGEEPAKAYNLSLNSLEAMFASHALDGTPKAEDEFRVLLLGDSSVWGYLLENDDTLSALLNQANLQTPAGKTLRFYNLGYPTISLTKDLMILDNALQYQPDLIVWLVTLESFPYEKQTFTPLVQHNLDRVRPLIEDYRLQIDPASADFIEPDFWARTIIGQRRPLSDLLRLQLYAPLWAGTGIDQVITEDYTPRAEDLEPIDTFYSLPLDYSADAIAFDVLAAGIQHAAPVPVLVVNEPMFVSQGENSDIRYNFFYPRWAYDTYRQLLTEQAAVNNWHYLDLWQAVDNTEYTNSAIHLTPAGSAQLAEILIPAILELTAGQ